MRKIDAATLRPGTRLPLGLYTRQGIKLLSAGTTLTEEMCRMIAQSKWADLYLAASAVDMHEAALLRLIDPVPEGSVASSDLLTIGGTLAVEAGQRVERHHAEAYELGAFIGGETQEDHRLRIARMKIADQYVADLAEVWKRLPRSRSRRDDAGFPDQTLPRTPGGSEHGAWPDETRLSEFRAERVARFRRVFARILSGLPVSAAEVNLFITELASLRGKHPERFAQLALLSPRGEDYLPEHCFAVACLSIAIAASLGWSQESIRLAGTAGLLADVGMALVPAPLRVSGRPLNEFEINRVRRHPTYSVVLLEAVEGISEEVRLAAYQHHERENGSGYPGGLRGRPSATGTRLEITDLARVVAVADAFAAAAARRRYRTFKLPYDALEEIIMQASAGLFDRSCVRALVESTGLFPIGSYVLLSNGSPAMVVGVDRAAIDRPIVRVIQPGGVGRSAGGSPGTLGLTVHLTDFKRDELWVKRPINPPEQPFELLEHKSPLSKAEPVSTAA